MKKIIKINLSGRVISMEDTAYEKLQLYIESLRRYFAKEESRDEIINDIESRIAELLHDKIRKGAPAISDADIDEVSAAMGRPEDFEENENTFSSEETQQEPKKEKTSFFREPKGRLYRDSSDKFLGGVCSGIAAYLNIDPTIVRILFAIVSFGGFGLGILIYIIMWAIVPEKQVAPYSGKRFFRNPDDQIIAGVCGGLGAYFNKNSNLFRLIFAAPILFSIFISLIRGIFGDGFDFFPVLIFGSLTGTLILAYIILWILLPEASGPYQKMEMRGERIDVNSISENVKKATHSVSERIEQWGKEMGSSAQNFSQKVNEWGRKNENGNGGLGKAIAVIFKAFFIIVTGSIALAVFIGLIAMLFSGPIWWPVNNFLWTSSYQQFLAWSTLFLFLIVPLVAFIVWLIRRATNAKKYSGYLGWTFSGLWAMGWITGILLAASLSKDFREREYATVPVQVAQPANNTLVVTVSDSELEYSGRYNWIFDRDETGWDLTGDTLKLSNIRFVIRPSKDSLYHASVIKSSFGSSEKNATNRASNIQYAVSSYGGVLDLSSGYAIAKANKYRGQLVEVEVLVPVNKSIQFTAPVFEKLETSFGYTIRSMKKRNNNSYWYNIKKNEVYTMQQDGSLIDSDGERTASYPRYNNDWEDEDDSVEDSLKIERKKQRIKEDAEIKIKKLEKKLKKTSKQKNESLEDLNAATRSGEFFPSINSFFSWF